MDAFDAVRLFVTTRSLAITRSAVTTGAIARCLTFSRGTLSGGYIVSRAAAAALLLVLDLVLVGFLVLLGLLLLRLRLALVLVLVRCRVLLLER